MVLALTAELDAVPVVLVVRRLVVLEQPGEKSFGRKSPSQYVGGLKLVVGAVGGTTLIEAVEVDRRLLNEAVVDHLS